jgi:hypothetical protein
MRGVVFQQQGENCIVMRNLSTLSVCVANIVSWDYEVLI